VAAASLLETLLGTVPFQQLLYKSDKQQQQRDLQVILWQKYSLSLGRANRACVKVLAWRGSRSIKKIRPLWWYQFLMSLGRSSKFLNGIWVGSGWSTRAIRGCVYNLSSGLPRDGLQLWVFCIFSRVCFP
jgi:hypothetical protein